MSALTLRLAARRHQDMLFAVFLGLLVMLLGAHALDRFWLGDDTPVLAHLLQHSLREIFFVPAVWQELSTANLTPWISLSFYVDYALAGPDPRAFHVHQLLSLWLIALTATRLLMLFAERWLAWTGAVLFLLGTPVLHVGDQLFTRHYLEGLLLCLLALYCFLQERRTGKAVYRLAGPVCYALAMTAKEVYVPLAVLLVFLTEGGPRQRVRQVLPYLAVLTLYLVWRAYMLSGHVGGYAQGSAYLDPGFWKDVAVSFARIPSLLFGKLTLFVALALFGVVIAGFILQPRRLPIAALVTALVFAPLVPLVAYPGITGADRYLFLPWFLLCCGFVLQAESLLRNRGYVHTREWGAAALAVLCIALVTALFAYRTQVRESERPYYAAVDTQMRYAWNGDAGSTFVPDSNIASSYGMVRSLGKIKQLLDPAATIPRAVLDPRTLDTSRPVYAYAADCNCMRESAATLAARHEAHALRHHAPLSLTVTNQDGWIAWHFGPYEDGTYNVIAEELGNLPLPATQHGLRTNIRRNLELTLRYTAPEGWVTYSPKLLLEPDGATLAWSRE